MKYNTFLHNTRTSHPQNSQVAEQQTHEKAGEIQTAPEMEDQVSSEGSHTGSNPVLTANASS